MIFFTSDLHLFHKNIITFAGRPFGSVDHMHRCLIDNWNKVVSDNDEVYVLGDVTFGPQKGSEEVIRSLKGRKHLVRGNHDKNKTDTFFASLGFESVRDYHELNADYGHAVLFHFPIESWHRKHYGVPHLHGHIHGKVLQPNKSLRRFDVGMDANNYAPISIFDIMKLAKDTPTPTHDHHGQETRHGY